MLESDKDQRREEALEQHYVVDGDCHYMESFHDIDEYMKELWRIKFSVAIPVKKERNRTSVRFPLLDWGSPSLREDQPRALVVP